MAVSVSTFRTCCVTATTLSLGKYTLYPFISSLLPMIRARLPRLPNDLFLASRCTVHDDPKATMSLMSGVRLNVRGVLCGVAPEAQWQPAREHHAPHHVHDGAVHALGLAVAGLVTGLADLARDTGLLAEDVQGLVPSSAVRAQDVDAAVELALKESHEVLELLSHHILGLGQEDAAVVRPVVDEVDHVAVPRLSLGVTGPFRSEQITPPMTPMNELAPVSLRDCTFLVCLPSAQVRQLSRL
ncbi:hypothetical protein Plhal304r1_c001g0004041 [Plasmopara halstedii]